jgi:hypothetical protein
MKDFLLKIEWSGSTAYHNKVVKIRVAYFYLKNSISPQLAAGNAIVEKRAHLLLEYQNISAKVIHKRPPTVCVGGDENLKIRVLLNRCDQKRNLLQQHFHHGLVADDGF